MFGLFKKKNSFAELNSLFVLRADKYPCDRCPIESDKCFKLQFADRTICVTDKDNVNSFAISERRKKTIKNK